MLARFMLREQVDAVELLARVRIPKTAPLLYLALDASPNVRVLAAHALVDMRHHDAIPKLREVLAKSKAALALAMEGDRRALTWVSEGLQSPTAEERLQAVSIASWFTAAEHKATIAKLATTDPDDRVRATAELALIAF